MTAPVRFVRIALDVPISDLFDYQVPAGFGPELAIGSWVLVPWGKGRRIGVVVAFADTPSIAAERIRPLTNLVTDAPPADPGWLALAGFAADYYHRSLGEVLLPAIPKLLRTPPAARARGSAFDRARQRFAGDRHAEPAPVRPLNDDQQRALDALLASTGYRCFVLHGITGSGKTEVYLQWIASLLARDPACQVLMLVPEIGLTPQLFAQFAQRFPGISPAVLHSDLADGDRAAHWLAAADGRARVIIGTRLAVLAPMPRLAGIVVDEEHDHSFKQQEGVRYSARDLAVAMASQRKLPIVLGSATPALETWHAARQNRYQLLSLTERAAGGMLPALRLVDLRHQTLVNGLTAVAIDALTQARARGEQALVFINRRGFAPVLSCEACGWISQCDTCSAYRVLHKLAARKNQPPRYRMVCHHCSADTAVPRACPDCGNIDLTPVGRGTQRLEEGLQQMFPDARIARLDRDVARRRGAAETVLAAAHAGEVDILVGTQMLAKGHDFSRLSVVVVIDADGGLYSSDFRAPERLFATLMQVAGRAGRSAGSSVAASVIVQTRFIDHPLFGALLKYDYTGFANRLLAEREQAELPPFLFQALLRAEAKQLDHAIGWLNWAREQAQVMVAQATDDETLAQVTLFDPVPMAMMRVAGTERAQLLIESRSRKALHRFVDGWLARLAQPPPAAPVRWQLEIDPLEI